MPLTPKSPAAERGASPRAIPSKARSNVKRARSEKRPPAPSRQQSLALPESHDAGTRSHAVCHAKQLWLCLYFPRLVFQAVYRDGRTDACAVFEERQGMRRIVQVNDASLAVGVHPGMSINAALSLSPNIGLKQRCKEREARLLSRLAVWAERYTSFVVLDPEGVLLLEVAGSRRLFGGLRSILH